MKKLVKFLIVSTALFALASTGCSDSSSLGVGDSGSSSGNEIPNESGNKDVPTIGDGMIYVEGGTFQMGSTIGDDEKPVHEVTVSSFYMGKYEVTQAEYQKVMGAYPSKFKGEQLPVECVSWYDAIYYCNKRSVTEGFTPCYTIEGTNVTCNWSANGYRLPTEAEWEYAARGGKNNSPYTYCGSDAVNEVAWYWENSDEKTHEVGKKKANASGLYDMSGNVWEWCWDWCGNDYYNSSVNNPLGPASGDYRVIRGGGWFNCGADFCRCAFRSGGRPDDRYAIWGFRVVRSSDR